MGQIDRYQVEEWMHKNKFTWIFWKCEPETLKEILMYGPVGLDEHNNATEMDLFTIKWLTDGEISMMIYSKTWINIETIEGIQQLNHKFSQAIDYYTKYLFKHVPKKMKENHNSYFRTYEDVIKFLRETEKEWRKAQLHCNLAKTLYCVNDILENPSVVELDRKSEYLINTKISKWLQINNIDNRWIYTWCFTIQEVGWKNYTINFKLKYRWKQNYSLIQKVWAYENYNSSELIKDWIWLEFEITSWKDALYLMQYISDIIYEWWWEIDWSEMLIINKWVIGLEDILEFQDSLHWDFKEKVQNIIYNKKQQTSDWYEDVKTIWKVLLPMDIDRPNSAKIPYWVEVKFVLKWNGNDNWINNTNIYWYYKKIQNVSRMQWYVTENYIKIVVNKLLDNYPQIWVTKEEIFNHYIKNCWLVEFTIWNKSTKFYTNWRWRVLRWTDYFPSEEIFTKK